MGLRPTMGGGGGAACGRKALIVGRSVWGMRWRSSRCGQDSGRTRKGRTGQESSYHSSARVCGRNVHRKRKNRELEPSRREEKLCTERERGREREEREREHLHSTYRNTQRVHTQRKQRDHVGHTRASEERQRRENEERQRRESGRAPREKESR